MYRAREDHSNNHRRSGVSPDYSVPSTRASSSLPLPQPPERVSVIEAAPSSRSSHNTVLPGHAKNTHQRDSRFSSAATEVTPRVSQTTMMPRDINQIMETNPHSSECQDHHRSRSLPDGITVRRDIGRFVACQEGAESSLYHENPPTILPPNRHFSAESRQTASPHSYTPHIDTVYMMGNTPSTGKDDGRNPTASRSSQDHTEKQRPRSNLTALLDQQSAQDSIGSIGAYSPSCVATSSATTIPEGSTQRTDFFPAPGRSILKRQPMVFEADSASGPVQAGPAASLPASTSVRRTDQSEASALFTPRPSSTSSSVPSSTELTRRSSWSENPRQGNRRVASAPRGNADHSRQAVRR